MHYKIVVSNEIYSRISTGNESRIEGVYHFVPKYGDTLIIHPYHNQESNEWSQRVECKVIDVIMMNDLRGKQLLTRITFNVQLQMF